MDASDVIRRVMLRADGEGVQARRPSGRCQVSWDGDVGPYEPDTPDNPRGDGDNKVRSLRGEHANKPLTPLRRECRCFGFICGDYTCVHSTIAHKAAGAVKHPAFPAPSLFT
jgi:hypothetical protein